MNTQDELEQLRVEAMSDEQIQTASILSQRIIVQANALADVIIAEAAKLAKAKLQETDP